MSQVELSHLSIRKAERAARRLSNRMTQTGRVYADFVIDGEPLSRVIEARKADLVSRLGWGPRIAHDDAIAHLLLEAAPDFPWFGGRTALYVCPECGGLDCGAITIVIERQDDDIVWREDSRL